MVVEADANRCEELRTNGFLFVKADALDEEILEEVVVKRARGLLVLLPSVANNLFITLTARELNPTMHIIARTDGHTSDKRLLQAGADSVISPYRHAGAEFANNILIATGVSASLDETLPSRAVAQHWIDVHEGSRMVGQTLQAVAEEMGREIIGLRSGCRDQLCPDAGQVLRCGDRLLIAAEGTPSGDDLASNQSRRPKVLIVDDDPTILRLYTRLLHRAGFIPLTACDGREALEIMSTERPDVAVIDQMLPVFSGIEVCERIRAAKPAIAARLVLFTSDEQPETRARAIYAGADMVVLKTSQASELIDTVVRIAKEMHASNDPTQDEEVKIVESAIMSAPLATLPL